MPASLLLAPAARGPLGFEGLLYRVTIGGAGTPMASTANPIGAQIFLQSGAPAGRFWKIFLAVSAIIPVLLTGAGLLLLALGIGA